MAQKMCPECQAGNPLNHSYCGQCAAPLEGGRSLARRGGGELIIGRGRLLPAPSIQQVGRAVAVSLLALAAEAGVAWLRRRVAALDGRPAKQADSGAKTTAIVPRESPLRRRQTRTTTVFSQRVVQVWENGRLKGQGVEQSTWQVED